jgi:hypothetical protein
LETCLLAPSRLPVGIAQMIVERRIPRQQRHRALEIIHCLFILAEPVMGPAETVDDMAGIRLQDQGLPDQPEPVLQLDAPVDQE